MLEQSERKTRIEAAHRFSIGWNGETTTIAVGISSKTIENFGYTLDDSNLLDKNKGTGMFVQNGNCPKARSFEEAREIAKILLPKADDLLEVINAKFATEFQNKARALLNQVAESKKAIKQATAEELKEMLDNGEITIDEMFAKMKALI